MRQCCSFVKVTAMVTFGHAMHPVTINTAGRGSGRRKKPRMGSGQSQKREPQPNKEVLRNPGSFWMLCHDFFEMIFVTDWLFIAVKGFYRGVCRKVFITLRHFEVTL